MAQHGNGAAPAEHAPAPRAGRDPGLVPAIIGFILAGIGILALGLWLGSRERAPAVPQLTLVAPAAGDSVGMPLEVVFDLSRGRLRVGPGGWGIGQLHVHAWIDDRELMPAAADIALVGNPSRYRWTISGVAPGERTLRLTWSDVRHQEVQEGASESVTIRVH